VPQRGQWGLRPSGTRNHLDRDFSAVAPNTKWVIDITYVRTAEHWLYRCVGLDLYSGLVVGWSMSPRQDRQLVVHAVLMALWQRPACTPVILHSDRGCQFTSEEYQRFLEGAPGDVQYECGGQLRRQRRRRELLWVLKRERVNRHHTTAAALRREPTSLITSNGVTIRGSGEDWRCSNSRNDS
jgi:putative transposase